MWRLYSPRALGMVVILALVGGLVCACKRKQEDTGGTSGELPEPVQQQIAGLELPGAKHGVALTAGPSVVVSADAISVDGQKVINVRSDERGTPKTIPPLANALRVQQGSSSTVLVFAGKETPVWIVLSAGQTAAAAGFAEVSFMAQSGPDKLARLPVRVPRPGQAPPSHPLLLVGMHGGKNVHVRWRVGKELGDARKSSLPELSKALRAEWSRQGGPKAHPRVGAVVRIEHSATFADLVALLDVVAAPVDGKQLSIELVPAEPVPEAAVEALREGKPLDPKQIHDTVARYRDKLNACRVAAIKADPKLKGTVKLQFRVLPAGKIQALRETGGEVKDAKLLGCLEGVLRSIQFPYSGQPTNGTVKLEMGAE